MTDPAFDTLEAWQQWERDKHLWIIRHDIMGHCVDVVQLKKQIARVRAAHSHLLKGHDDE